MHQLNPHTSMKAPPLPLRQLPVLQKLTDTYRLWHGYLQHLPRLSRYTLGVKIDTLFCDCVELILMAGYAHKDRKITVIEQASTKLDALKFFLQIAWEVKALDHKKFIQLSEPLVEVGKMLGGWRKQLKVNSPD